MRPWRRARLSGTVPENRLSVDIPRRECHALEVTFGKPLSLVSVPGRRRIGALAVGEYGVGAWHVGKLDGQHPPVSAIGGEFPVCLTREVEDAETA